MTRNEVKVAISRMKNGKTTGMDGIPVEVRTCLGEKGIAMLCDLMQGYRYEQDKIPTEWIDSGTYVYTEWMHTGLWQLPGDTSGVTSYQDLGNYH